MYTGIKIEKIFIKPILVKFKQEKPKIILISKCAAKALATNRAGKLTNLARYDINSIKIKVFEIYHGEPLGKKKIKKFNLYFTNVWIKIIKRLVKEKKRIPKREETKISLLGISAQKLKKKIEKYI